MKIAFFGTPQFAVPSLKALIKDDDIEVCCVFTQMDKKVGRKQQLMAPPVKVLANAEHIPLYQPASKKELEEIVASMEVDFFVVIAYGMILSEEVIKRPKISCVNIHPSILPKYRGATPIQSALLNGDDRTAVSIMQIVRKPDAGPVYHTEEIQILAEDNFLSLSEKLENLSAKLLPEYLKKIEAGLRPQEQDDSKASHCRKIEKSDGQIDFNKPAEEIINMLRAFSPWPGIFTDFDGKKLKIIKAHIGKSSTKKPGTMTIEEQQLQISTSSKDILPEIVQIEGKKEMDIKQFINGKRQTTEPKDYSQAAKK